MKAVVILSGTVGGSIYLKKLQYPMFQLLLVETKESSLEVKFVSTWCFMVFESIDFDLFLSEKNIFPIADYKKNVCKKDLQVCLPERYCSFDWPQMLGFTLVQPEASTRTSAWGWFAAWARSACSVPTSTTIAASESRIPRTPGPRG